MSYALQTSYLDSNGSNLVFQTIVLGSKLKIQPSPISKDFNTTIMATIATIADCSVSF